MSERRKPGRKNNFGGKMMNFTLVHTNLEMPVGFSWTYQVELKNRRLKGNLNI